MKNVKEYENPSCIVRMLAGAYTILSGSNESVVVERLDDDGWLQ